MTSSSETRVETLSLRMVIDFPLHCLAADAPQESAAGVVASSSHERRFALRGRHQRAAARSTRWLVIRGAYVQDGRVSGCDSPLSGLLLARFGAEASQTYCCGSSDGVFNEWMRPDRFAGSAAQSTGLLIVIMLHDEGVGTGVLIRILPEPRRRAPARRCGAARSIPSRVCAPPASAR